MPNTKYRCECQYCGHKWEHDPSPYSWRGNTDDIRCVRCNDAKIKKVAIPEEGLDVYGYRFSPPFKR